MIYAINELLAKMGAPEASEKKQVEWFYFDKPDRDVAGMASIRFEANGERLIAELKQVRENVEDDDGKIVARQTDRFFLSAERTARAGHYRVINITFDDVSHDKPSKAVTELGLSMFHAKALDISLRMIEQAFNKEEMLDNSSADVRNLFDTFMEKTPAPKISAIKARDFGTRSFAKAAAHDGASNVVMFRPRNGGGGGLQRRAR